ncbi:hypothetical protein [Nocardia sp. NRRL S-836]|uniref:hypothetical protein n=1 Tax=Nocardia sp. NRRL S-836 TaxID=1519492 RepID=UPI0006AE0D70|nr:hypothetical protein [Nocardia sp. NRRL S-836]KOV84685.1 hypothetical protein ADL03_15525 [Nocardia sp. NRRL S-836]
MCDAGIALSSRDLGLDVLARGYPPVSAFGVSLRTKARSEGDVLAVRFLTALDEFGVAVLVHVDAAGDVRRQLLALLLLALLLSP